MIKTETAPAKSTRTTVTDHRPTPDEIAIRAHEIFIERGGEEGHDVEDWLRAEHELSGNGSH